MWSAVRWIVLLLAGTVGARAEQVVISKIMYHPPGDRPEYFELYNNTATPFDIANWRVTHAVEYEFPDFSTNEPGRTFLKAFERIVLSDAPTATVRSAYQIPDSVRIFGPWKGKLKNGEDRITVKDKNGVVVCTVKYGDRGHWPRSPDGAGHALVLKNPNRSIDDWRNWAASELPGGSPGQNPLPHLETPAPDPHIGMNQGLALINYTDTWRYEDSSRDLGSAWRNPGFDDSQWPSGQGILGFTKDKPLPPPGEKTLLKKNRQFTYYFRKQFVVDRDLGKFEVAVDQVIDDGAVYYLNGKEIARVRMPAGVIGFKTPAAQNVRDPVEELNAFEIDAKLFLAGTNLLAVEVHQDRTNSSDVAFAMRLRAFVGSKSPVVLNELALLPNNGGFIEFFNNAANPVNLKGYFVTDTPENRRKSQIKSDLIVGPSGLAALDFGQLGLVPTNPVSLYLLEPDGETLVDGMGASFANDTRPIGRKPSGGKSWFRFPEPTRGQPNATQESSPRLKLNEIHFTKSRVDWIEVYNPLPFEASAAGLFLSTHRDLRRKIPLAGKISPHGFASWPISIPVGKEEMNLYLIDSADTVLDCFTFGLPAMGDSWQAFPDGTGEWYSSSQSTRNASNRPQRNTNIVINEIMYDAPKSAHTSEYIELFNRGEATVDLSDWELTDAVHYKFPRGVQIPAQGYLVIGADASRMKQIYGEIPVVGDFSGKLHNRGALVRLIDRWGNLANQVDYKAGGDWPVLAKGGGSSMELINPWMDNSLSSAWRDSDETAKSKMREYAITGTYEELHIKGAPTDYKELHFHLVGESHIALENIFLGRIGSSATNFIVNGTQLSDDGLSAKGWLCQGTHWASYMTNNELHLISDGRGDNRPNRAEIDATGMTKGDPCQLKFNARWISGNPRLIAQTWDHSIAGSFPVEVPPNLGTPGKPNSRLLKAPPPQIDFLAHAPVMPHTTNAVTFTATIHSAAPLRSVELRYRLDNDKGNGAWTNLVMADDGLNGDMEAHDDIYSTQLAALKTQGQVFQFYVLATAGNGMTCTLPRSAPDEPAMFVVDNRRVARDLRTARFIVSAHDIGAIADGNTPRYEFKYPRHSNRYFNATFISNEEEIFYNGRIRNSGSPWTRSGGLDRPKFKLPEDRRFRSHAHFYFDNDPAGANFHNRVTRYWLYLMGHPASENEIVRVVVNGFGIDLREDTEPVHNDFLDRNFHLGSKGQLYRIDDEWWFMDNWDRDQRDADWGYKGSDNPGRYRTEWMKRTNEADDDFSDLIQFFKLVSGNRYTQAQIEKYLDPDAILRYSVVRAYIADWDTFTMGRGKNSFFYQRPTDGRFQFFQWDSDLGFGDPNSGFTGGRIQSWLDKPYNRRLHDYYLAEFSEKYTEGSPRFRRWLQEEHDASTSYKFNPHVYLSWCTNRQAAVLRELGENYHRPFAITPPNPSLTVTNEIVSLTGTAPITLTAVHLDQQPGISGFWKDAAHWRFTNVHLQPGPNAFVVKGLDRAGKILQQANISIVRTNLPPAPKPSS